MEKKKIRFRVKRVLSRKNREQSFFVEAKECRRNGFKVAAFYFQNQKVTGLIKFKPLEYKDRQQAEAASARLHRRINRPLPEGMDLMSWLRIETAKIANAA